MSKPEQLNRSIHVFVLTISDTRTIETDKSGKLIIQLLEGDGHHVVGKDIISDDINKIQQRIKALLEDDRIEAIITNGGTGISKRDITIEAIEPLLDKQIPGFGEIFRTLSYYEDIGATAIMSRAIAGVASNRGIFVMPGSSGAVKLAMNKIILKELVHVTHEIQKQL